MCIQLLSASSCNRSKETVLSEKKDAVGRLYEKVVSGYTSDEGSYQKTFRYDTLGRLLEERAVVDGNKHKIAYFYYGDTSYALHYYDLGPASTYSDSVFISSDNQLSFIEYVRLNNSGIVAYELRRNFDHDPDSIYCTETLYDTTGNMTLHREIACEKALHSYQ
jgi:hypothetical protein